MPHGGLSTFFSRPVQMIPVWLGRFMRHEIQGGSVSKSEKKSFLLVVWLHHALGRGESEVNVCDPMDLIVHGLLQARILQWVAFPFSRDLPNPGIKPRSPALQADSLPAEQGKPKNTGVGSLSLFRGSFRPRNRTRISCIAGGFFNNWAIRKEVEVKVKMGDSNIP